MRRKNKILIILLALSLILTSCGARTYSETVFALDTFVSFTLYEEIPPEVKSLIYSYEKMFSRTDEKSELYRLNLEDKANVSEELYSLIEESLKISEDTMGAFDIRIGEITALWDFKSDHPMPPSDEEIKKALSLSRGEIKLLEGTYIESASDIDLGGVAKGYIAEKAVAYLRSLGIESGLISLGGNIASFGKKPDGEERKIGIRDPMSASDTVGYIKLTDGFVSVSGDYERFFLYDGKKYHHIIDPSTGMPAEGNISSVAVISKDGVLADALSTALFVLGYDSSIELYEKGIYDFEAVFIFKDGTVKATDGAEFYRD